MAIDFRPKEDRGTSFTPTQGAVNATQPIDLTQTQEPQSFADKALGAGSAITEFLGAGPVAETFGAEIAKLRAKPGEKRFIEQPGVKETVGGGLQLASALFPVGRTAQVANNALRTLGLTKGAGLFSKSIAGGAAGATFDVGGQLQGEDSFPSATAIGASVPFVAPFARGLGVIGSEAFGVTTGTGAGSIQRLFKASQKGGEEAKAARQALRGYVTPATLVEDAKGALGVMAQNRTQNYTNRLQTLEKSTEQLDVSPVISELQQQLKNFGIKESNGVLDFSRSNIRFDNAAQKDVDDIFQLMKTFGTREGDRSVIGVDGLKRAFADKFSESSSVRAFTEAMRKSAKKIAGQVPGYAKMESDYAKSTQLINDVRKALSLGDRTNVESAFKKLLGSFRTNNEFRRNAINELDQVTDNYVSAQIAGQQMSELLPRGIMRSIGVIGAGVGSLTGVGIVPLLKALALTSPRLVGEMVNVLGASSSSASKIMKALEQVGGKTGPLLDEE